MATLRRDLFLPVHRLVTVHVNRARSLFMATLRRDMDPSGGSPTSFS